jgi:hypothetical protein
LRITVPLPRPPLSDRYEFLLRCKIAEIEIFPIERCFASLLERKSYSDARQIYSLFAPNDTFDSLLRNAAKTDFSHDLAAVSPLLENELLESFPPVPFLTTAFFSELPAH